MLQILIATFALTLAAYGNENTSRVKTDFVKCSGTIKRTERTIKRIETDITRVKSDITVLYLPDRDGIIREIESISNQVENHKERLERIVGMSDKINGDLQNLSGPVCPSCIVSSVNLYCRNAENLSAALRNTSDKLMEILIRVRNNECRDKAGISLLKQARISLDKADSLFSFGDTTAANQAYRLYETLINMSSEKCGH